LTSLSETDPRVRTAVRRDLDALVELYREYELASETTIWQVRGTLRRVLARQQVLVAEEDGRMVGALVVSGPTSRFYVADALTVLPEARSRGIGWTLGARVQRMANERGVGITAAIASSNPMSFDDADLGSEWWAAVGLRAPYRFRGQGRLRQWYGKVGRREARTRIDVRSDGVAPPVH
jgi:N-acetylglutamate synthase-like GNAT family acetyltransferase